MDKTLQNKMFAQLATQDINKQASVYGQEYLTNVLQKRVFPSQQALDGLKAFQHELPQKGVCAQQVLDLLHTNGSPATVATQGGRYFGLVTGASLPIALGARLLADHWDQVSPFYKTSPINGVLEEVVQKWLADLFGLRPTMVAGYVSGSSAAILAGLLAARWRLLQRQNWDVNKKGVHNAPPIKIITGRHTHGTVLKALAMMGMGTDSIMWVDVDEQGRICADKIPKLDETCLLILQAGNVNSGAFDDFEKICARAQKAGAWTHIDGAFGLWAQACPFLAHLTKGMQNADSFSVDGHKTLNIPYANGLVLCHDKEALQNALHMEGSYLVFSDEMRDGGRYTAEMSRRARVVELWAALAYLGREGVADLVTAQCENATFFAQELRAHGFEILNDVVFNQVLVGCESAEMAQNMMAHIQDSGECWVGSSSWHGRAVLRISVCSWATTKQDVLRSVQAFMAARNACIAARTVCSK